MHAAASAATMVAALGQDKRRETKMRTMSMLEWISPEMSRMSLKCHNYPILCRFFFLLSQRPTQKAAFRRSADKYCYFLLVE